MFKKILCASVLAATTFTTHAAPQTWNFSYTGFMLEEVVGFNADKQTTTTWRPDLTISGSFTAEDRNHNNVIEKNELTKLLYNNQQYVGCEGDWGPTTCYLRSFSYTSTGQLNFDLQDSWESSGNYGGGHRTTLGQGQFNYTWNGPAAWTETNKLWTAQTSFSIDPAPAVPEPETYAMLGAGLLALVALQRRRTAK